MNTDLECILSYYAGFIDGEGYIGIKKYKGKKGVNATYSERISVGSNNKNAVLGLNDMVQGHIYKHKPSKLSNNVFWSWELTDKKARDFIKTIRPYLRVKHLEASIVVALGNLKAKNGRKTLSKEDVKLREKLYLILKLLHHKND